MSNALNVQVEQVNTKDVTTKFGAKKTYSFKAGGAWYNTGFKKHNLNVGDVVSFDYTEGTYGKDVEMGSLKKGAAAVGGATTPPAVGASVPSRAVAPSGGKGVFPIPAL